MSEKPVLLIVDDDPINLQILANCLNENYLLKVAINGSQAIALAEKEPLPDLILLDIGLPDMNGYEVFEQLNNNDTDEAIPVIFVTGKDQQQDEVKGLKLGAVDYITKPICPTIVLARVKTHITIKQQQDKLLSLAIHDQLTGVYNRHFLMETVIKKIAFSIRHKIELSLIMMDIDHFKQVNDNYGHPKGDYVLKTVAKLLIELCREEDIITRFGGEEFIILLDQTNQQAAHEKAELIRKTLEKLNPDNIKITCSFGVTQLNNDKETIEDLIKQADLALYQAKESGRNQVAVFSQTGLY
ncbi:MAG: diguanylate cyclase [gamma proteobacterium symbiont of Taylorina sp.]|nr:diguanylate cyclase [gamma proteobacterium symbiont of Taylorina sp.]